MVDRMFITDLDGTLLRSDGTVSSRDIASLQLLGNRGVARIIATGRSPYSFFHALPYPLPVDYLIFSTGVGILKFPENAIFRSLHILPEDIGPTTETFFSLDLDFMIHDPVPENHRFAYHWTGNPNPDFFRRIDRYRNFARPLDSEPSVCLTPSQLLAVVSPDRMPEILFELKRRIHDLTIIRSTSPLDHLSTWIELFHPMVSKSRTALWLADQLGISADAVFSIGNDYNDLDLLEWSGTGLVVSNAPEELKNRFPTVSSHDANGVSEAIEKMLAMG